MELSNAFRVFKSRNYSLFFTGQLISRLGMWMQRTAVIWLVYSMTDSVLWVGITTFAEQFPSFILSPVGGITADRYNRYKVLMITQIVSAIQAVLLTIAFIIGFGSLGVLLALSLLLGIANSFDVPARQAMVNDLVNDSHDLPGAIAMNSSLNNLTRLAGPALAGIVLARFEPVVCFGANAVSFIAVIICLSLIHFPRQQTSDSRKNVWAEFREGWQYMIGQVELRNIILLAILVSFFVTTYNTLQPYFAENIFEGGASYYGYITSATGLGALISTLFIASQKTEQYLKKLLFSNLLLLGIGLIVMSFVRIFPLYLLLCALCGFGVMSLMPICNTVVQTVAPATLRGRVISFLVMATLGALPLGSLFIGWVEKFVPTYILQTVQGTICLIIALAFCKFLHTPIRKSNA